MTTAAVAAVLIWFDSLSIQVFLSIAYPLKAFEILAISLMYMAMDQAIPQAVYF